MLEARAVVERDAPIERLAKLNFGTGQTEPLRLRRDLQTASFHCTMSSLLTTRSWVRQFRCDPDSPEPSATLRRHRADCLRNDCCSRPGSRAGRDWRNREPRCWQERTNRVTCRLPTSSSSQATSGRGCRRRYCCDRRRRPAGHRRMKQVLEQVEIACGGFRGEELGGKDLCWKRHFEKPRVGRMGRGVRAGREGEPSTWTTSPSPGKRRRR